MHRLVALVIATAVVAVACSSEGPAVPTVPPTTTIAPSTTPAPALTTASDGATLTTAASSTTTTIPPSLDGTELALQPVASGFDQPVFLTAPQGDSRLFVVDQVGIIWVIDERDPEVFLDIADDVAFGGERGLLGLAFHPDYTANGLFYVNYTATDGATNIVEFMVSGDPNRGDASSGTTILEISQPARNHNGGMVTFGPEGNLWIGMGDGGGGGDQFGNGQRSDTLLGAMLRILVGPGIDRYEIPDGNPFADGGGAPEVWAIGLRNPWRFHIRPGPGAHRRMWDRTCSKR